jgi:hypothetical protein
MSISDACACQKNLLRLLFAVACFSFPYNVDAMRMEPPPGISADNAFFRKGYLDVTLYGADSSGNAVSTAQIKNAVNAARDYQLVCYFPSGTYLVDDTICCMMKAYQATNGVWHIERYNPCLLAGDPSGRPKIQLADGAQGYSDPAHPKPVVWYWAEPCDGDNAGSPNPTHSQDNICFNQQFRGIDIDLGNNNPGACGIRFFGAQGSTVEDVSITADGAFAGLYNSVGQGGGTYNLKVTGGKYAVYLDPTKFCLMAGCTFSGQTDAVFHIVSGNSPMILAGFHIEKQSGPVITGTLPEGGLTLVDGSIETQGGTVVAGNAANQNLYMKNIYISGSDDIVEGVQLSEPDTWSKIVEYASCPGSSTNLIDGTLSVDDIVNVEKGTQVPTDLISRHIWDESSYPSLAMELRSDFVNVMDSVKMIGMQAKGDSVTDDAAAIKYAIANYKYVFLPKGTYAVGETIVLGRETQLFGPGRTLAVIRPKDSWNPNVATPVIETVDDPDATTSLSFISIDFSKSRPMFEMLKWRAGASSIVRGTGGQLIDWSTEQFAVDTRRITITGSGGGRWYANAPSEGSYWMTTLHEDYRGYLIDGTTQPLSLYGVNVERILSPVQSEIKNSANVSIYYLKSEAGIAIDEPVYYRSTTLRISNSNNIRLFGLGGNVNLTDNRGVLEIDNSDNILVTHLDSWKEGNDFLTLKEELGSDSFSIPSTTSLSVFKRAVIDVVAGKPVQGQTIPLKVFGVLRAWWVNSDRINIETAGLAGRKIDIKLFNMAGRQVHSENRMPDKDGIMSVQLDNKVSSGVYCLKMLYGNSERIIYLVSARQNRQF